MARARNLKPSIFKNELLGQADPILTLLFQGLWTLADRRGILEDRPLRIKAELFPYRDGLDVNGYLTELQRLEFIERFTARKLALIYIVNFTKHQSPHPTEKPSDLPDFLDKEEPNQSFSESPVITPLSNGSEHVVAALIPYSLTPDSLKGASTKKQTSKTFVLPDWIPKDQWQSFEEMRKKMRKPMTDRAKELIVAELHKLCPDQSGAGQILDQSVRHSWQDVYALKEKNGTDHQTAWAGAL
ncbi:hypothetical protein [Aquidulcibacter sp.]|uniref:hypothetical protein n=1 Tax=Aquidulcibacter sp. TaxID=2052990 RepID=UPI0025BF120B|nr:hypothetical protein [Aquidulcibacter sp.]